MFGPAFIAHAEDRQAEKEETTAKKDDQQKKKSPQAPQTGAGGHEKRL